jgi:hypothetical protein
MKKILALVLAFAVVFAFAACGKKEEAPTTVETTFDQAALDKEFEEALKNTQAAVTKVEEAVVTNAEGQTEIVTEVVTEAPKGLTSQDIAAIVEFYNAAEKKTEEAGAPAGMQTMKLGASGIQGDGAVGAVLGIVEPVIKSTLEKNSNPSDYIPGKGVLEANDVSKATAISKNGKTTIRMEIKSQTDGPDAPDGDTTGPVARAIGTLGNIDGALTELGATIKEGRENVKLKYTNAYIECVVDEATGTIVSGHWHHTVNINITNAKLNLVVNINLKNLDAAVEYDVVI